MTEHPEVVQLAASVTGPNATAEDRARIGRISKPLAAVLVSLPVQDRYNVMGSLLATYALTFTEPINAFDHLVSQLRKQLPAMVAQVAESERRP